MDNVISIEVNVKESGSLASCISANKKHLIQELKINGYYCAEVDDVFIKSMCNTINKDGKRSGGQLEALDFTGASVKTFKHPGLDTIGFSYNSFNGCITLKRIKLGRLTTIDARMFSGCISLESIIADYDPFTTKKGILYQRGCYKNGNYSNYGIGNWKLIKYPSAHQDPSDIDFSLINEIADYAFEDFRGTELYLSKVPPACTKYAFNNVDVTKIVIHVPKESRNSYWSHPVWGDFPMSDD
jgi:hypothetical protein